MAIGARTKRIRRIAKVYPIVEKFQAFGKECDGVWWSRRSGRGEPFELSLPLSINARGDEPYVESNYEIAQERLDKVSAFGADYRVDLWPGGSIYTLTVRADDALAVREAQEIVDALQNYPFLSDDDVSRREWDRDHPDDFTCDSEYADDETGDCGCGSAERKWAHDHPDESACDSDDWECPCGRNAE
ncbi:hypothetical protein [Nocardia brasiliensis]|uniref:hypothetical protein n=1 Tax=Nocardia brasiliensis TaxID=37326 RepID=UPI002458B1B5|nr:hypothetical protein [Nocardia brasiliensis]